MAAASNYSLPPRGPQWLIYSGALGGAVRRRTPSLPLCWLSVLDGSRVEVLHMRQRSVWCVSTPPSMFLVYFYTLVLLQLIVSEGEVILNPPLVLKC